MAGPEIKQVQEAADSFADKKIDSNEAEKINTAVNLMAKDKNIVQDFFKDPINKEKSNTFFQLIENSLKH